MSRTSSANGGDLADRLDSLLAQMAGALRVVNHPHHLARSSLGVNDYGWTAMPYNDEAFRLWSKLQRDDPSDLQTLHHLAVLHHARAFDLECGRDPSQADPDWRRALEYWHEISTRDDFWEQMARGIDVDTGGNGVLADLRRSWQEQLLQVHFDIAMDPDTKLQRRINFHVRLALESPFPDDIKRRVREHTYERHAQAIDTRVWQADMLDPEIIEGGVAVIAGYLERDPGCPVALWDLARLQARLALAWVQRINAVGGDELARNEMLGRLRLLTAKWKPYLDQLLDQPEATNEREGDAREKLSLWYRTMGDAHRSSGHLDDAVMLYQASQGVATDHDEHRRLKQRIGEVRALQAASLAGKNDEASLDRAKRLCEELRQTPDLSEEAYCYLAVTYQQLGDLDAAEEVCEAGIANQSDSLDFDEVEKSEQYKEQLRQLLTQVPRLRRERKIKELMEAAVEDLQGERFEEACRAYDEVLSLDADFAPAYVHRCQCHLALTHPNQARADLVAVRKLSAGESAPAYAEVMAQLSERCKSLAQDVKTFGRDSLLLRRRAVKAFNDGRHEEAAELLRSAMEGAPRAGRQVITSELVTVLVQHANASMAEAISGARTGGGDPEPKRSRSIQTAMEQLREAVRLEPRNGEAKEALVAAEEIARQSGQYGGVHAFNLQQEAAKAFNSSQLESAEKLLREALGVAAASGRPRLQSELATVLASRAMRDAQSILADRHSDLQTFNKNSAQIIGRLQQAANLDPGDEQVTRSLREIQEITSTISSCGGPRAFALQQEAVKAYNAGQPEKAVELLRNAIGISGGTIHYESPDSHVSVPRFPLARGTEPLRKGLPLAAVAAAPRFPLAKGTERLRKELAQALVAAAVQQVNAHGPDSYTVVWEARAMLEEAVELDPGNVEASTNLDVLKRLTGEI